MNISANFYKNRYLFFLTLVLSVNLFAQKKILIDDFETTAGWKIIEAEQVSVKISNTDGFDNKCLTLGYNFIAGSGYGGIQKKFPLTLPENYEFSFFIKAESPVNTLEFKLLDEEGSSVWWYNNRNYNFPKEWTKVTIKQRQISKAWGPSPELKPKKIDKIEIIITSVNGGKGTVYLDKFQFEEKPAAAAKPQLPVVTATSSFSNKTPPAYTMDSSIYTYWESKITSHTEELLIDLKDTREFGGLVINWHGNCFAKKYDVFLSDDKKNWRSAYSVSNGKRGKAYIDLHESDAQYIKLLLKQSNGNCFAINEIELKPIQFSAKKNNIYQAIAAELPKGCFPKYFNPEQSYFTVIGVNKDAKEALMNEEGMIEADKSSFSVEPFIYLNNKFLNWSKVITSQHLEDNYLPIPSVNWKSEEINLTVKAFADGEAGKSLLNVEYTLKNSSNKNQNGTFYLAVRPFQVNPPSQELNTIGGTAKIASLKYTDGKIFINQNKVVVPLIEPDGFGAVEFDHGDISNFISKNILPAEQSVADHYESASGALKYSFNLKPDEEKKYYFIIPFHQSDFNEKSILVNTTPQMLFKNKLNDNIKYWKQKLDFAKFTLPAAADKIINTLKTSLAYILINRDNYGFQPGSRSYERSWIRDGAMTSSSLLKMGITQEVKEYIDWYSSYQYPNGKIPCVVDTRGPDPVPENDSQGEYIFLINQYFLFTKDTGFLKSKFENIKKTVGYIEYQISQTKTDKFKNDDSLKLFYGLLPESISHEGYSEKPMHSYWDDFFNMKGLKDAVEIAKVLGKEECVKKFTLLRDEFKTNFYNSMNLSIKRHRINYVPGCADLGDFDATSTAIGLLPCNEKPNIPQPYLDNTFKQYYKFFTSRRDDKNNEWVNYTPYEIRNVGAFNYLDLPETAHELLSYFLKDQRPNNWNHWAEVVWHDPKAPRFIGDMPHTWVASDFVNSIRSFFVYEDELNQSLVIGSGLYQDWIDAPEGINISNLNTYYGILSYSIKKNDNSYCFNITGNVKLPVGKIIIKNFNSGRLPREVVINGKTNLNFTNSIIPVDQFPAEVVIKY